MLSAILRKMVHYTQPYNANRYVPLRLGQVIRFKTDGRYDCDFKKGDGGLIEEVISPYPRATDTIYLVTHEETLEKMWVTGKDIEEINQLDIFFERCEVTSYKKNQCVLGKGHGIWHEDENGSKWSGIYAE